MCASEVAPFLLQRDAFSCRDAPLFNRSIARMISNHALFEYSVNVQPKFSPHFRCVFAVVNSGTRPYCWGALRNESNSATANFDSF